MYPDYGNRSHQNSIDEKTLEVTIANLQTAGVQLPDDVTNALQEQARVTEHIEAVEAKATDPARVEQAAVEALSHGEGDEQQLLSAVLSQMVRIQQTGGSGSSGSPVALRLRMINNARRKATDRVYRVLQTHGDQWITHHFRPVVTKLVKQLRKADVPEFNINKREHLHALEPLAQRPEVAAAWDHLNMVYKAAGAFRRHSIIPSTLHRPDLYEFKWSPDQRDGMLHTFTMWTYCARQEHEPGIYTEEEVQQHLEQEGIQTLSRQSVNQKKYDELRKQAEQF